MSSGVVRVSVFAPVGMALPPVYHRL